MIRSFIAIDLPSDAVDALTAVQARLRIGKVVKPENLHLTLSFLGDQDAAALETLHDELATLRVPAFEIDLIGLDCFASSAGGVLYAAVAPNPALDALHSKVTGAIRRAGLLVARARFRPHVTLIRLGRDNGGQDLSRALAVGAELSLPSFSASHFSLFRSTLAPSGAVHESMADYPLTPQPI